MKNPIRKIEIYHGIGDGRTSFKFYRLNTKNSYHISNPCTIERLVYKLHHKIPSITYTPLSIKLVYILL
jgi:hypothetical protein